MLQSSRNHLYHHRGHYNNSVDFYKTTTITCVLYQRRRKQPIMSWNDKLIGRELLIRCSPPPHNICVCVVRWTTKTGSDFPFPGMIHVIMRQTALNVTGSGNCRENYLPDSQMHLPYLSGLKQHFWCEI